MSATYIVFITTPNEETSLAIAKLLVESSLAACVNLLPKIRSIYKWEGKVCDDQEQLLLVKTTAEKLDQLIGTVKQNHPYDVPETVAVKIEKGNEDYLKWISENC